MYTKPARKIHSIFIHCSASDNPDHDDVSVIDRWHVERGWDGIGYHYFINKEGEIQEGRELNKVPAAQKGNNVGTIAICVGGNKEFSEKQFSSLRELCYTIVSAHARENIVTIRSHNEVSNKTCPNFDIKEVFSLFSS